MPLSELPPRLVHSLNYRTRSFVAVRRNHRRWSRLGPSEGGPRILLIESRVPHAWLGAGYPRSNLIVHQLVHLGYRVTLYPLISSVERRALAARDLPQEVELILNYGAPRLRSFMEQRGHLFECSFVTRPHNMEAVAPLLRAFGPAANIYDAEALASLREVRMRQLRGEVVSRAELDRLLEAELQPARAAACISAVSSEERGHIERVASQPVLELGYASVPRPTPKPFSERAGFLFLGAVANSPDSPNTDALTWFLEHVFPEIQQRLGDRARVRVVGACDKEVSRRLARPGVDFAGPAANLFDACNDARVLVAATRFSAGLPLKVFEAAAHGVPLATSNLIARQVGWTPGSDFVVADDPREFAERCLSLHEDERQWCQLRDAALERVRSEASLERFRDQLRTLIATTLHASQDEH